MRRTHTHEIDPSSQEAVTTILISKYFSAHTHTHTHTHTHRITLKSGEAVMDTQNPGDVAQWVVDHDFKIRYLQSPGPEP
jgi:hypothetical protein